MAVRQQLEITAFHEAGHAVMAMSNGFLVSEISSRPFDGGDGYTRWKTPPLTTFPLKVAAVLTYTAGMAADFLHWRSRPLKDENELCKGHGSDYSDAQPHLADMGQADLFFDYLGLSLGYLQRPDVWPCVESLANLLIVAGTVNGRDVLSNFMQRVPRIALQELDAYRVAIDRKAGRVSRQG